MRSDLLVINKIDLAPYVGASLEGMDRDAREMRGDRPFLFRNLRDEVGLERIISWLEAIMASSQDSRREIKDAHAAHASHQDTHHEGHAHRHDEPERGEARRA